MQTTLRRALLLALVAAAAAACSPNRERIYNASLTGGDYAILSCDDLATAVLSIEQRLAAAGGSQLAGPLSAQRDQLTQARIDRACPGAAAPQAITPTLALADPDAGLVPNGRRLQIATFRDPANRDRAEAEMLAAGYTVDTIPIVLGGVEHYRVLIGPLSDNAEIERADAILQKMGLRDAFFVN